MREDIPIKKQETLLYGLQNLPAAPLQYQIILQASCINHKEGEIAKGVCVTLEPDKSGLLGNPQGSEIRYWLTTENPAQIAAKTRSITDFLTGASKAQQIVLKREFYNLETPAEEFERLRREVLPILIDRKYFVSEFEAKLSDSEYTMDDKIILSAGGILCLSEQPRIKEYEKVIEWWNSLKTQDTE